MGYRSILFDVDGVLLRRHDDHPDVYRESVSEAFQEFGVEPSVEDLNAFVGTATLEGMGRVCDRHGVDFESFWPRREQSVSDHQQRMMERGERYLYDDCTVLADLADACTLGLVSNNQHETIRYMVEHFGLATHFEAVYGREPSIAGFRRTKPDTHYLERALADVGTDDALFVGDSDADIAAAHEAGLDSAFVRRPHRLGYAPSESPTYEIDGLDELREFTASAV
jgi:HAD superfamily hydrolase (TIGR01549 family)